MELLRRPRRRGVLISFLFLSLSLIVLFPIESVYSIETISRAKNSETDIKYKVLFYDGSAQLESSENGQLIDMVSPENGYQYRCLVPFPPTEDELKERAAKPIPIKTPSEHLESMTSCLYRLAGWWTYEFCRGSHIRQFHQEEKTVVSEFFLGKELVEGDTDAQEKGEDVSSSPSSTSSDTSETEHGEEEEKVVKIDMFEGINLGKMLNDIIGGEGEEDEVEGGNEHELRHQEEGEGEEAVDGENGVQEDDRPGRFSIRKDRGVARKRIEEVEEDVEEPKAEKEEGDRGRNERHEHRLQRIRRRQEAKEKEREKRSEVGPKFYTELYIEGTVCDLTGEKRETTVRFLCSESGGDKSYISDITEPSSCKYLLTVATPLLCKHPEFRPREEIVLDIDCYRIETQTTSSSPSSSSSSSTSPFVETATTTTVFLQEGEVQEEEEVEEEVEEEEVEEEVEVEVDRIEEEADEEEN